MGVSRSTGRPSVFMRGAAFDTGLNSERLWA
eukprot:CAMPEP_0194505194 /NCGR_PEP_ID=MMETSP0253-20130528/31215_1 /TAXON_ID=2966 /ORGANISM="Noctiluca scintillans" /LENGTH=30 /DNA_ID= /DNA_START= /DNA_END= /DNA_ORIENTATION=